MRARVVISAGSVSGVALLAGALPAAATEEPQEGEPDTEREISEQGHCVEEAVQAGQDPDKCIDAPNPILPATNELIWGSISFVVLLFLLWKFAFPAIKRMMDSRAERIRTNLDEAERVRAEAQGILDDYQRQLADARNESARIIEEARQTADSMRRDLIARAEQDAAELRQRAQEDINAERERAFVDLRARVAELAVDAAEMVVQRSLADRDTQVQLIEDYINRVGSQRQ